MRRTLGSVLGLGTLLLPAALAPVPPWTVLSVSLVLTAWCLLVARSGGTADSGAAAFVRSRLGAGAARLLSGLYFAGIACGQAGVALGAGVFAGVCPYGVAVSVLLTATVCATRELPVSVRRVRLPAVLALAGAWWLSGGTGTAATAWPAAAVVLLFGWVGLEGAVPAAGSRVFPHPAPSRKPWAGSRMLRLRTACGWSRSSPRPLSAAARHPGARSGARGTARATQHGPQTNRVRGGAPGRPPEATRRSRKCHSREGAGWGNRPGTGLLLGLVGATAVYLLLLSPPAHLVPPASLLRPASAVLCLLYCWTNLRATSAHWAEVGRRKPSHLPAAALALGVLGTGLPLPVLLLAPGAATAGICLLIALAALFPRSSRHVEDQQGAAHPSR